MTKEILIEEGADVIINRYKYRNCTGTLRDNIYSRNHHVLVRVKTEEGYQFDVVLSSYVIRENNECTDDRSR